MRRRLSPGAAGETHSGDSGAGPAYLPASPGASVKAGTEAGQPAALCDASDSQEVRLSCCRRDWGTGRERSRPDSRFPRGRRLCEVADLWRQWTHLSWVIAGRLERLSADCAGPICKNRRDSLSRDDGRDCEDGAARDGRHVTRMLNDATVLMRIPLHSNVTSRTTRLPGRGSARGIPTTLNTPALDKVLMPMGASQRSRIRRSVRSPISVRDRVRCSVESWSRLQICQQLSPRFFTSFALELFSLGGPAPRLPLGIGPTPRNAGAGSSKTCRRTSPSRHPTSRLARVRPVTVGRCSIRRISSCRCPRFRRGPRAFRRCSCRNSARCGTRRRPGRSSSTIRRTTSSMAIRTASSRSPTTDPGRALISGQADDIANGTFDQGNAFKISPLRGIRKTGPVLPRQLREDTGGRGRALSAVLPDRERRAQRRSRSRDPSSC